MADVELIAKKLEDIELEITRLRTRGLFFEMAFTALWRISFAGSAGSSPHESVASLLGMLSTFQQVAEDGLRADATMSEDERERRLGALAETMKELREIFLIGTEDLPQEDK